jgi:phage gp29-like protein
MATVTSIPPKPTTEEIVNPDVLKVLSLGMGLTNRTRAFGGKRDPSDIWDSMMRNLPDSFDYYFELEEKDDDIGGLIETLKLAVLGRQREFQPGEPKVNKVGKVFAGDDSDIGKEVAAFVDDKFKAIPDFHGALHALLDGPAYGLAISEINYNLAGGEVSIDSINSCPQQLFSFADYQYLPQIGQLRFKQNLYQVNGGTPVQENKFLIFSYNKRHRNRFGRPLLRRAFWPSWFKRQCIRFWLRFAEKGPGTAAVLYPSGATADEKKQALDAADAIINEVAVALPENFQLVKELLTSARAQSPAVYERLVLRSELAIARSILGETLTSHGSEGGAGSFALGQVHQEMFHQREIELARALESIINDQLVKNLVLWNYGTNVPMPRWCIETGDPEDLAIRVRIDQGLQNMGLKFTERYLRDMYNVPNPAPDDVFVTPTAAAATPAFRPLAPGLPDDASFSDAQGAKAQQDVNRLLQQFRSEAHDIFSNRVIQIADEVELNGGVR